MEFKQSLELGATTEQQRENYEKNSLNKVQAGTHLIEKLLGRGLTKEGVIFADAKAEDKYRSLLKDGEISEEEFVYLTENDIEANEGGLGIIGTHNTINGIVHGNQVLVKRENHVKDDNHVDYSYEAQINGQDIEMNQQEGEAVYDELLGVIRKRDEILGRIAKSEAKEIVGTK
ncbi:MAG: hypothetical protein UU88_C0004G0031 [Parcubacteria group bacterium GW2011_GWC1_42_11]|uniref:Uncharacterized protein n=1 Tax=Candidatus Nomurabacteria bacterium GW2011_GWC2_42_20 TaxID=1618756 RepID=A0A0G0ZF56_9BACT|nr:MAG: hypothetical protein UU88_C0004G0031 [Parcubacteria group bacterium GW2011_GWC1_42_11]KKS47380.1 MAG: hypothetical protein UV12_C0008G0048 [Candidatus Nomurabacteria bacterium GW2011_GWC2_42_20]HBH71593.1 hypothetical protein [Candidatus Yonathbacteria bacterium]